MPNPSKMDTSPREGMLQKIFGPSFMTRKRTEDIELPSDKKKKKSIFGLEINDDSRTGKIITGYNKLDEFSQAQKKGKK